MAIKVLFILPYPLHRAPSQRFRIEAYFRLLHEHGIDYTTAAFLDDKGWKVLYQNGSALQKLWSVLKGFLKRIVLLFTCGKYDYIVVHREGSPVGPPIVEWIIAKVLRKKMIFDFDDAIWIPAVSESNRLAGTVKCFWKIKYICKWSYKIAAGNTYLAGYARQYNNGVQILPTCVDTENRFNQLKNQQANKVTIGWTGSHSTLPYLDLIVPVLQKLEQNFDFEFLVICNQPPSFPLKSLTYIPWKEATEIQDLLRVHIGVMPLMHDAWSEGKCGFKIIQYLSLGIPAVASPVGVNKIIIQEGCNGFLCTTEQEWHDAIATLIKEETLRTSFGEKGRQLIIQQYSIAANSDNFLSLFS